MSAIRIGDIAPNFIRNSTHGRIGFHGRRGRDRSLPFSYAGDFAPPRAFRGMAQLHADIDRFAAQLHELAPDAAKPVPAFRAGRIGDACRQIAAQSSRQASP